MKFHLRCGLTFSLALATALFDQHASCQTPQERAAVELEQQGKNAEAENAWKALNKSQPQDPMPLAHLGLLESRQEHFSQAIVFYREAMALNPNLAGLRLNLGLAYFKAGSYRQAIEIFKPLLASAANADETQRFTVLIGMSHYGLGEYATATPFLQRASTNDSSNLPLLLTLAHSCLLSKQYQCVLDAYHRIVALNANSAEADMLVGEALDAMKDSAGAIKEFRAATAANPKEPNAHFGLGYLLWTQKQYEEAAVEFQAELSNVPDYTQAMVYLADSYIQINKLDAAENLLDKLAKNNSTNFMVRLDLGIAYSEGGRKNDALRELRAAEALKPKDVNVHWRLGRLYRSMGRSAEAKVEFDKAQTLNKAADDALLDVMNKSSTKSAAATEPAKHEP